MGYHDRTEWHFQLINGRTMEPIDDDSGIVNILTEGDPTHQTIYAQKQDTTAVTQNGASPPTFSNGKYRFFTAPTVTAVDVSFLTANGEAGFVESLTPSQHRLVVWPEQPNHTMVIPYFGTSGVQETGFRIWDNMVVDKVYLRAYVGGTAVAMDIGTSTDPNGFLDAALCSTTGWKYLEEDDASGAARIFGDLLTSTTSGAVRTPYVQANTTSGSTIVYDNTASEVAAAEGYIFIDYRKRLAAS